MMIDSSHLVPIRTVCAMYNLNPNTLRTWERRYGLITPKRSEGGHRGYAQHDLVIIERMLQLITEGYAPGDAAAQVRRFVAAAEESPASAVADALRARFRQAVEALDQAATLEAVRKSITDLGYQNGLETVLFSELSYLGDKWKTGECGVATEHIATLSVLSAIAAQRNELLPSSRGVPVTLACAPGEQHSLPILHVANLLLASGMLNPIVLVSGLPIGNILEVSRRGGAKAVVISATMAPRPDALREWVSEIALEGWENRTVLVGGGFTHSRIFSETAVKSAPGNYDQVLKVLVRMLAQESPALGPG